MIYYCVIENVGECLKRRQGLVEGYVFLETNVQLYCS